MRSIIKVDLSYIVSNIRVDLSVLFFEIICSKSGKNYLYMIYIILGCTSLFCTNDDDNDDE